MSSRLSARSAPNMLRKPGEAVARRRPAARSGVSVARIGAVAGDGGAAAEAVGIEIDRDDDARAESARAR